jgi:hypothetical protein
MTLYGNAALLLFYSLLLAYKYRNTENSLLISYEKRRKLNKFIKVTLCVSLTGLRGEFLKYRVISAQKYRHPLREKEAFCCFLVKWRGEH